MTSSTDALSWLRQEPLAALWATARRRLERNGLLATGRITVTVSDPDVRQAVAGVLGKQVAGDRIRIDLADLDSKLRSSAAVIGLVAVVEHATGPLTNRPAVRAERAEQREALWAHVDELLCEAGLAADAWVGPWLDDVRRTGTLTRLGEVAFSTADTVVAALAAIVGPEAATPISRGVLAHRVSGTAHGLDDSTTAGRLVLRALAHALGTTTPTNAADRRTLWRVACVAPDDVSTTVVTLGLRPTGNVWADLLRQRSEAGAETHLDDREITRINWELPVGTLVHLCENPRVIEEAIDAGVGTALVCTLGNPTTVAANLIAALLAAGAQLRYHGDFDWPGVAIAQRMLELGCSPWRMSAVDYEDAVAIAEPVAGDLPQLSGPPVPTPWDRELAAAMSAVGRAVHEEALIDVLLSDLGRSST